MGNWEKNKKDSRRLEDRGEFSLQFQDHKKKKLKPTEKSKYRLKPLVTDEDEDDQKYEDEIDDD